jgi:hypothetical protein
MHRDTCKHFIKTWLLPPGFLHLAARSRYLSPKSKAKKALLKSNQELAGRHEGQRCFIMGSGSSIKEQDIRKLKGEYVISLSNGYVHPDYSYIAPQYHALPPILSGHGQIFSKEKFSVWLKDMSDNLLQETEMFLHIGDKSLIDEERLFGRHKIHWVDYGPWSGDPHFPVDLSMVPHIWTVSELAITLALYLGFEKIYLIGMDHDWFNGPINHFYDHTKDHALKFDGTVFKNAGVDMEFQMRRHADIFKKYKYLFGLKQNIYNANANPHHYLDVFPKVDFDTLLTKETP